MEPVEINAGAWYLRGLRADDRVDDRPALAELGETDPHYVADAAAGWTENTGYRWGVCEPTTGELFAEVSLDPASGHIAVRTRPGHDDAARAAAPAVARFAAGALALVPVIGNSVGAVAADEQPGHTANGGT